MSTSFTRRALLAAAAATALTAAAPQAFAADPYFGGKSIKLVVPYPAGGTSDILARLLSQRMAEALGATVVVENKAGATGNLGSDFVAKSAPDGLTLLLTDMGSVAIAPSVFPNLPYDPVKDFAPVSLLTTNVFVVAVPASSPANNLREFIALAKAKKGALNYGSAGSGQGSHLGMELLKGMAGFDAVHVPFSGIGPVTAAVLGGQVDVSLLTPTGALPHVKSGRLKILAMTGTKRSPLLPGIPTVAESGVPGYELTGWIGLLAPAGTPKDVVDRLQREIAKALKQPDVAAQLDVVAAEPVASTPQEFAAFLQSEIVKWGKIIKQSGAKAE